MTAPDLSDARRHLASMDSARRALLEREWLEAEAAFADWNRHTLTPEIIARAAREWEDLA